MIGESTVTFESRVGATYRFSSSTRPPISSTAPAATLASIHAFIRLHDARSTMRQKSAVAARASSDSP